MKLKRFDIITTWIVAALLTIVQEVGLSIIFSAGKPSIYERYHNEPWFFFSIIVGFFFTFFQFFCLFVLPVKIIILISRGKPFDTSNVKNLYAIATYLVLYDFASLIELIIAGKLAVPFNSKIPNIRTWSEAYKVLPPHWKLYLLAGAIVFVIAKAFKRGYDLQKEQELTI